MTLTIVSYNVLATAYIRAGYYPRTDPACLVERSRLPAVAHRIEQLGADVCCLQEVERDCYRAIEAALAPHGFDGHLAMKDGNRPDGCATFHRRSCCRLQEHVRVAYDEGVGSGPSGHIAQLTILEIGERQIGVANTHLTWDPPDAPLETRYGYRQVRELVALLGGERYAGFPWVVCGDFNAEPSSATIRAVRDAGFRASHTGTFAAPTCVTNARAKTIDYIFCAASLMTDPLPLPSLDHRTPLPSAAEPSDHVPVVARVGCP